MAIQAWSHLAEEVSRWWVSELADRHLSRAEIETQSPAELEASLKRVDKLIADRTPLTRRVQKQADGSWTLFEAGDVEPAGSNPISIPIDRLLDLRNQILEQLVKEAEPEKAEDFIALRTESEARREEQKYAQELEVQRWELEADERRSGLVLRQQEAEAALKRQWWQTRLSRDSIAAIVGGVLLVGFAITVIVAMFTDTATSDVVQNSFLLILGYFFGAAAGRRPASPSHEVNLPSSPAP